MPMSLEELVKDLQTVDSPWQLVGLTPQLKEGLSDLLYRVQNLEYKMKNLQAAKAEAMKK